MVTLYNVTLSDTQARDVLDAIEFFQQWREACDDSALSDFADSVHDAIATRESEQREAHRIMRRAKRPAHLRSAKLMVDRYFE